MSNHSCQGDVSDLATGYSAADNQSGPAQPKTARARQRSCHSDASAPYPGHVGGGATSQSRASRTTASAIVAPCRTAGRRLPAGPSLGFCPSCEAVYRAAQALREQLIARRGERLRAAHRPLLDALSRELRDRLLAHVAARTADCGQPAHVFSEHGLEDFLAELRDVALSVDGELT
jgi:hypothetical protein